MPLFEIEIYNDGRFVKSKTLLTLQQIRGELLSAGMNLNDVKTIVESSLMPRLLNQEWSVRRGVYRVTIRMVRDVVNAD